MQFLKQHVILIGWLTIFGALWGYITNRWITWQLELRVREEAMWQGRYTWMRMPIGKTIWIMPCRCSDSIQHCSFHGPNGSELYKLIK